MRTLHSYAARELLKTFLMTVVALTVLLVMGGGVANLFRGEGAGARELLKVFLFFTPVAITLILPVAALFSSAITYGRMAADNEILACQAAGINIHRLLLSAFLLGLFTTAFTYLSWNYLLPSLSGQIAELTRKDLPTIVMSQFQKAKPLSYGKYNMTANRCEAVPPEQVPPDARADHTFLHLRGVSFVEMEGDEPARYGTADETIIDFDHSRGTPRVTVDLQGVRSFDAARWQYYELEHQILGPFDFPLPVRQKTKFETRGKILHYRQHPEKIPEIDDRLWGMKREMMTAFLAADVESALGAGRRYVLAGPDCTYEIEADEYQIDAYDGRPCLRGKLRVTERCAAEQRQYSADKAFIELKSSMDRNNPVIEVQLVGNVEIVRVPQSPDAHAVKKPQETLPPLSFRSQESLRSRIDNFDLLSLLDESRNQVLYERPARLLDKLQTRLHEFQSEMLGELHFRASYSLGAVAIVVLGAILGIIVRGGQVLTAFGISCVPMVFMVVASIVGRNMADRPQYILVSIIVMWGTTALMYAATGFVAFKVLKR